MNNRQRKAMFAKLQKEMTILKKKEERLQKEQDDIRKLKEMRIEIFKKKHPKLIKAEEYAISKAKAGFSRAKEYEKRAYPGQKKKVISYFRKFQRYVQS